MRGTNIEQDGRWGDKNKKLKGKIKFPKCFDTKVSMNKVNMEVMRAWVTKRMADFLEGTDDDVPTALCINLLEASKTPDPRDIQIQLTGFLQHNARPFCEELWNLLVDAQAHNGIPESLLQQEMDALERQQESTQQLADRMRKRAAHQSSSIPPLPGSRYTRSDSPNGTAGHLARARAAKLNASVSTGNKSSIKLEPNSPRPPSPPAHLRRRRRSSRSYSPVPPPPPSRRRSFRSRSPVRRSSPLGSRRRESPLRRRGSPSPDRRRRRRSPPDRRSSPLGSRGRRERRERRSPREDRWLGERRRSRERRRRSRSRSRGSSRSRSLRRERSRSRGGEDERVLRERALKSLKKDDERMEDSD